MTDESEQLLINIPVTNYARIYKAEVTACWSDGDKSGWQASFFVKQKCKDESIDPPNTVVIVDRADTGQSNFTRQGISLSFCIKPGYDYQLWSKVNNKDRVRVRVRRLSPAPSGNFFDRALWYVMLLTG